MEIEIVTVHINVSLFAHLSPTFQEFIYGLHIGCSTCVF